jgi:hypothetical protein
MSASSITAFNDAVIKKLQKNPRIRKLVRYQEHEIDLGAAKKPDSISTPDWNRYIADYIRIFRDAKPRNFNVEIRGKIIRIQSKPNVRVGDVEGFIQRQLTKLKNLGTTSANIAKSQSVEHLRPSAKESGAILLNEVIAGLEAPIVRGFGSKSINAQATIAVNRIVRRAVTFSKRKNFLIQNITSKDLKENIQESNLSKGDIARVYDEIRDTLKTNIEKEILKVEGSDSLPVIARKMAANAIEQKFKKIKNKNVKTKFKGNEIDRPKVKKITSFEITTRTPSKSFRSAKTGQFISRAQAQRQQVGFSQSPLQLIKALNSQLPKRVAANMGTPKLNFRTGRFASSTHITDIQQTRTGMMSIGYSYQLNPYDVFEMGRGKDPWKTPERDPRKIIDESIRELMVQYTTERFTTRRTT